MRRLRERFDVWCLGFAALAVAAVLRNAPDAYVVDNRFEQYWNPGRRLSRGFTLWDASRGLGRVREELWPGATAPIGLLRLMGASPAVAEHLWHGALLTAAATGMVALLRCYRPVLGPEHLLAGGIYAFGPHAATFLLPSNLFFHHALVPWLAVLAHRGVHEPRSWRPAAAFALLIWAAGNLDTPGLVFAGVAVMLVVAHAVVTEAEVTVGQAGAWAGKVGGLALLVSAAALVKTAVGVDAFSQRLEGTETIDVISATSSWSESLRGLGLWLSYFRDARGHVRPEGQPFFTDAWMVLLTFAPVVVALAALWWARRWRTRSLFVALLLVGTLLMVGAHPAGDPAPWGQAWEWAVRSVPGVGTLRTTFKAGSVAALGTAALFGLGVSTLARVLGRDERRRRAVLGMGGALVVVLALPFWTGRLYGSERRLDDVPEYWRAALDWLDAQPDEGQVLVLPGSTRSVYRWGWPGDDIHDALLERPHLVNAAVSLSRPLVADVLEAVDAAAVDRAHEPGALGPALRRLGIRYVLLRNDLDWARMGVARPADYSELRADPDLQPVATFGRPGQGTAGPGPLGREERALPPVEVLEVRGDVRPSRAVTLGPWSLLEGGGAGWFSMAASGLLVEDRPVVPAALLDDGELAFALQRGSPVVVTDTNRRRAQGLTAYTGERSRTLAAGEDLGRDVPDLYGVAGSQSVATFGSATRLDDPGVFRSLSGFRPEQRPAQAVDGDLRTGWVIGPQPDQRSRSLRIELRSPQVVERLRIVAFDPTDPERSADPGSSFAGVPRIGRAAIVLSDGTTTAVNLIAGRAEVSLPPRATTSIELRILDVTRRRPLGIAEISAPGLDLRERVQVPDDLFRRADASPALRALVERAPVSYLFDRVSGEGTVPVEAQLRRRFRTTGERQLAVRGRLTWDGAPPPVADAGGCADVGLTVDGRAVPVRLVGPAAEGASFSACSPLTLGPGWHDLDGSGAARLDHVVLATSGDPVPEASALPVDAGRAGAASRALSLAAPAGAVVLPGDGYDQRWRASVDGAALGAPIPVDGQNGWIVPAGSDRVELTARFGPDRLFRGALAVSWLGVGLCLVLVARPRRRVLAGAAAEGGEEPTVAAAPGDGQVAGPWQVAGALATVALFAGLVLGPWPGLAVVGAVALALARRGPDGAARLAAVAAAGLVALAAMATVSEARLVGGWNLRYATDRPLAAGAAALAAALASAVVALPVARRRPAPAPGLRRVRARPASRAPRLPGHEVLLALAAAAGAVVALAAVRIALGPSSLTPELRQVAANVAAGIRLHAGLPSGEAVAPLTPVLLLVTGLGARGLGALAVVAGAAGAVPLQRWRGWRAVAVTGAAALVVPSLWSAPLPLALAGALVAAALALLVGSPGVDGRHGPVTARSAAIAGAFLGAAVLADPTTVTALVAVGLVLAGRAARWAWSTPDARPQLRAAAIEAAAFVVAGAAVGALALFASRATGTEAAAWWWSGGPLGAPGPWWAALDVVALAATAIAAWRGRLPRLVALVVALGLVTALGRGGTSALGWAAPLVVAGVASWLPRVRDGQTAAATDA